jgi:hypothetical protein
MFQSNHDLLSESVNEIEPLIKEKSRSTAIQCSLVPKLYMCLHRTGLASEDTCTLCVAGKYQTGSGPYLHIKAKIDLHIYVATDIRQKSIGTGSIDVEYYVACISLYT